MIERGFLTLSAGLVVEMESCAMQSAIDRTATVLAVVCLNNRTVSVRAMVIP